MKLFTKQIEEEFPNECNQTSQNGSESCMNNSTWNGIPSLNAPTDQSMIELMEEINSNVIETNEDSTASQLTVQTNGAITTNIPEDHSPDQMDNMDVSKGNENDTSEVTDGSTSTMSADERPELDTDIHLDSLFVDCDNQNITMVDEDSDEDLFGQIIIDLVSGDDENEENVDTNTELRSGRKRLSYSKTNQRENHLKDLHSNEQPQKKTHESKAQRFKCNICNKKCRQMAALIYHRRLHMDKFPIHCRVCLKRFSTRDERNIHENDCKVERYECCFCRLISSNFHCHRKHMRVHTGEKNFYCSYCKKGFTEKSDLISHARIHGNKNSFQYTICKKRSRKTAFTKRKSKRRYCK